MKTIRRTSLIISTIAVTGLAAFGAVAQGGAASDPQAVKAGVYTADAYHSQVIFSVSHLGLTPFSGFFSGAAGTLTLDPAKPAASKLNVSVQINTLDTTVSKLTDELKGDQWLDAAKYATATFTSTSVKVTGKTDAEIVGNLTLHGVTKPITLKAHFIAAGENPFNKAYTTGFSATGSFKRSDFGLTTYLPAIGDEVQLKIAGAFELKQ